jgi:hypothetical protein
MKTCRKCGKAKENSAFPRNPRCCDGLSSWCSACHVEATRRYRARKAEEAAAEAELWRKELNRRLREHAREAFARRRLFNEGA